MKLSKAKIEELARIAQPLVDFLANNAHPECSITVSVTHVKLNEGIIRFPIAPTL